MKNKLVIGSAMSLFCLTTFAQEVQPFAIKTDGHLTSSQQRLITNTLLYINKVWADQGKSLSRSLTEKYFDPNTTLILNGKKVCSGYAQFEDHFRQVSQHIRGKFRFPLLEVMRAGNKLIVRVDEDVYDNNGINYPTNVIAIFTLHKNRIQQWEEVVNSKYWCQAGSTKVIFSNNKSTSN